MQNEEEENSPNGIKLPTSAPLKITQATEKSRSSDPLDPEIYSTSENKNAGKHSKPKSEIALLSMSVEKIGGHSMLKWI